MSSVNSQLETWQNSYYEYYSTPNTTTTTASQEMKPVVNKTEDTAIVITSSWIPTHPSTFMVDEVVKSTEKLIGLSPTAPIFITIDHFRYTDFNGLPPALKDRIDSLEEYSINLMNQHLTNPRIHIIPGIKNLHIGGSVMKAMNLIEKHYPSVKYLYYLQHDFYFAKNVDHTGLIKVMEENEKVNWVRFAKRDPNTLHPGCGQEQPIQFNRTFIPRTAENVGEGDNATTNLGVAPSTRNPGVMYLSPTTAYSDNNHLTRFKWYKETIASMKKLDRAPEDPLIVRINDWCLGRIKKDNIKGLYIYKEWDVIAHLDGRQTQQRRRRRR